MATGNSINANSTGIVIYDGAGTFSSTTTTQYDVLCGGANNTISNIGPGSAGQILQSGGAGSNPAYSTATYPATAGTAGNVLTSNGTNFVSSAGIKFAEGTLTSSQIKNAHGTPIEIVPAAGNNTMIVPVYGYGIFLYGGSDVFVAAASQQIQLYYGTTTYILVLASNGTITGTSDKLDGYDGLLLSGAAISNYENLAMNAYNPVGTEISGNASNDNTIYYNVAYYIMDWN